MQNVHRAKQQIIIDKKSQSTLTEKNKNMQAENTAVHEELKAVKQ